MKMGMRPIVIVGMQRSGTSALAGALAKLGVFFGKEELLYQGDANNPNGYFEHRKATLLNLRCLQAFQMHPTSLGRLPANWKDYPQAESLREELKAYLKSEFGNQERWGIKQPVTSLVLPLYNDVFEELGIEPHYVLCVRNPLETMASEAKLDFGNSYRVMPSLGMRAIGSWLRYTLGSVADTTDHLLSVVPYTHFLSEPQEILQKLVEGDPTWEVTDGEYTAAVGSVRSDLRHHQVRLEDLQQFPEIVLKTYIAAVTSDSPDEEQRGCLLELHQEFEAWREYLGDPVPSPGKLGLAWREDGRVLASEVGYVPSSSWQTLRLHVPCPPKSQLSGLLYGFPYRAWIRRAIWRTGDSVSPATLRSGLGSSLVYENGVYRLDGVYEPNQINVVAPGSVGPHEFEIEFLLETGPSIFEESAGALARKLEGCVSSFEQLQQGTF